MDVKLCVKLPVHGQWPPVARPHFFICRTWVERLFENGQKQFFHFLWRNKAKINDIFKNQLKSLNSCTKKKLRGQQESVKQTAVKLSWLDLMWKWLNYNYWSINPKREQVNQPLLISDIFHVCFIFKSELST